MHYHGFGYDDGDEAGSSEAVGGVVVMVISLVGWLLWRLCVLSTGFGLAV